MCYLYWHFNPHVREGSDILVPHLFPLQKISIHTSAKEVTKLYELLRRAEKISIHTSAKEVTLTDFMQFYMEHNFNPHFREGSDADPARGAPQNGDFNPHFREGSDMPG